MDEEATTQAEIVEITPGAFFTSVYADGSVVETGFPQGEDIKTKDFISQTVTTRIEDAYQVHLQNVSEFQANHGAPQTVRNMHDYLYWDGIYRTRHARRKMRRVFQVDLAQALALAYGIVVSLVVWMLWQRHAPMPQWITDWDRGLFILLAPAFGVSVLSVVISLLGSRRNRKQARNVKLNAQ
jgi:hypothetical protein